MWEEEIQKTSLLFRKIGDLIALLEKHGNVVLFLRVGVQALFVGLKRE